VEWLPTDDKRLDVPSFVTVREASALRMFIYNT